MYHCTVSGPSTRSAQVLSGVELQVRPERTVVNVIAKCVLMKTPGRMMASASGTRVTRDAQAEYEIQKLHSYMTEADMNDIVAWLVFNLDPRSLCGEHIQLSVTPGLLHNMKS